MPLPIKSIILYLVISLVVFIVIIILTICICWCRKYHKREKVPNKLTENSEEIQKLKDVAFGEGLRFAFIDDTPRESPNHRRSTIRPRPSLSSNLSIPPQYPPPPPPIVYRSNVLSPLMYHQ